MALEAGTLSLTLEYAKGLKDRDWFCKMDPYCIVRVGPQVFRSRTAKSGGRNPVWNQAFLISIINENDCNIEIKDDDIGRDEYIGSAAFSLARAREQGSDNINVPVTSKRSNKQHGFLAVALKWTPNTSLAIGRPASPAGVIPSAPPTSAAFLPPPSAPPAPSAPFPSPAYTPAPPPPPPSLPPTYTPAPPPPPPSLPPTYIAPPPQAPVYVAAPPPPPPVYIMPPPPPTVICAETLPIARPLHHHHHGHHHHHHFGHHHHHHGHVHLGFGFGHHRHHHHHGHHHHHFRPEIIIIDEC